MKTSFATGVRLLGASQVSSTSRSSFNESDWDGQEMRKRCESCEMRYHGQRGFVKKIMPSVFIIYHKEQKVYLRRITNGKKARKRRAKIKKFVYCLGQP